jgi:hypothetical protein
MAPSPPNFASILTRFADGEYNPPDLPAQLHLLVFPHHLPYLTPPKLEFHGHPFSMHQTLQLPAPLLKTQGQTTTSNV